nr:PepSY domain-containing protein [uncultured Halomonas sp.]
MKHVFLAPLIVAVGTLSIATTALAAPQCTDKPQSEWKTEKQMKAEIDKMGYRDIKVFQVSGNCYEIYAHTKDGGRAEVYFNPVTGEIVQKNEE